MDFLGDSCRRRWPSDVGRRRGTETGPKVPLYDFLFQQRKNPPSPPPTPSLFVRVWEFRTFVHLLLVRPKGIQFCSPSTRVRVTLHGNERRERTTEAQPRSVCRSPPVIRSSIVRPVSRSEGVVVQTEELEVRGGRVGKCVYIREWHSTPTTHSRLRGEGPGPGAASTTKSTLPRTSEGRHNPRRNDSSFTPLSCNPEGGLDGHDTSVRTLEGPGPLLTSNTDLRGRDC